MLIYFRRERMKLYEKKVVPGKVVDERVGLQCDLCGKKSPDNFDWTGKSHKINETELSIKVTVRQHGGIGKS